jgi:hypothetical protein
MVLTTIAVKRSSLTLESCSIAKPCPCQRRSQRHRLWMTHRPKSLLLDWPLSSVGSISSNASCAFAIVKVELGSEGSCAGQESGVRVHTYNICSVFLGRLWVCGRLAIEFNTLQSLLRGVQAFQRLSYLYKVSTLCLFLVYL